VIVGWWLTPRGGAADARASASRSTDLPTTARVKPPAGTPDASGTAGGARGRSGTEAGTEAGTAVGNPGAGTGRETVPAALNRLAQGRARAFQTVSEVPLTLVDEPGSPALAADRALVGRLRAAGVRLEGVSFTIAGVRSAVGAGGALVVHARVTTSAHRQVSVQGSRAAVAVPVGAPRAVVLTLVPAVDGTHWLVREAVDGA
jgi:eukaryotic-like serine/threonine-protein kinase